MPDILRMLSQAEQLDFSQNFLIPRPNYIGDTIFPDRKTQNFKAEYLRLAAGSQLPTMALVHGLDTEAHIGSRPALERVTVESSSSRRRSTRLSPCVRCSKTVRSMTAL